MVFKVIIGITAAALLVAGFVGWRMDLELLLFEYYWYLLAGVALGVALIWGRVMAPFVLLGSLVPIGYAIVVILLDKSSTWASVRGWYCLMLTGIGLGTGIILWLSGSEAVLDVSMARSAHAARPVFCDLCGQHLGRAGNFTLPCPACGHNVYVIGDD